MVLPLHVPPPVVLLQIRWTVPYLARYGGWLEGQGGWPAGQDKDRLAGRTGRGWLAGQDKERLAGRIKS